MWPFDQIVELLNQQRLTERDKNCIRQLVAQEVDLNFGRLMLFFAQLVMQRHNLKVIAAHLDLVIGDPPVWERVRWDSAPILIARSMSRHDLLRVGRWYTNLDLASQRFRRVAQQSAILRTGGAKAVGPIITEDYIAGEVERLLKTTAQLVDNRRPFVHPAVEEARKGIHAGEPAGTVMETIDPEVPTIYQDNGEQWVPITAASILEEYEHFGS